MPTLQTIWDEDVYPAVQDGSLTAAVDGVKLFNRCIDEVSGLVLLPDLETIGTVDTVAGVNHAPMPTGYQRNLRLCRSQTHNRFVPIYGSSALLFREYRVFDLTGPVTGVAVKGSDLYYQRVPASAETLDVHYWASPTAYALEDTPDVIPVHLQRALLRSYALWKLYYLIEDGMDGMETNVIRYAQEFQDALGSLSAFIGPEHNPPIEFYDEACLDWVI